MNLGRYQLMGKLASGGMAEVFLAKAAGPMGFEKKLVVKRILPHLAEDESFIEMFFTEARLAARLDHPNIVQIFDFGEADGAYFIAMEYIDGLNLRVLLKRVGAAGEQLPIGLCAKIISSACEGLAYAHELVDADAKPLRLVHRDISSDNILVSTHGAVKLADFGIAKAADQMHRTQTGVVKGKVAYMPPEQLKNAHPDGKPLDARADLFALGVVLYELLTGHKPFQAEHETALMLAILHDAPTPVTRYREDVPPQVQRILERALAKDRDARYASCRELQLDLERFLRTVDEPVGPVDIARWVTRFAAPGSSDASKTPNAKLLLETPSSPSLAAPAGTVAATRSQERTRLEPDTEALDVAPARPVEPATMEDAIQTASNRLGALDGAPSWRRRVIVGGLVLAVVAVGVGVWFRSEPTPRTPAAAADTPAPVPEATRPAASPAPPVPAPAEPAPESTPPLAGSVAASPVEVLPEVPTDNRAQAAAPSSAVRSGAPKPASSSFRVESNPAGFVKVNGKSYGRTPVDVANIPSGRVTVEVFDKQLGFSKQRVYKLKPGDNDVLRFEIAQGQVSFLVLPYASVSLDGKLLGDTPLAAIPVYEGRHRVTLRNDKQGEPVTVEYEVKPGKNQFTFNFNTLRK